MTRNAITTCLATAALVVSSDAALNLTLNPNSEGNWVFHLTGTPDTTNTNFFNDLRDSSRWNETQGGSRQSITVDTFEPINIEGSFQKGVRDLIDVGDEVVSSNGRFIGLTTFSEVALSLNFSSDTASTADELETIEFNDTLIARPTDKNSFSETWNTGTYGDDSFTFDVVPEPTSALLLTLGAVPFLTRRRKH